MLSLIGLPRPRRRAIRASCPAASSSAWRSPARWRSAPRILLLDEPLSALDAKIRVSLREELRDIQRELGITAIFVTHDQEEALALSHRGRGDERGLDRAGAERRAEVYRTPRTPFVATFVGTANVLPCAIVDAGAGRVSARRRGVAGVA
jgi:putative spermidine/putrescine transport system ATP-binding protein